MDTLSGLSNLLSEVRSKRPLVHHITNYVTVNDCANIVLALGASPVMADDEGEVAEMVGLASALVLNIGTLNERTVRSMVLAGKKANEKGIPVVLDPVGAGATSLRTRTADRLLKVLKIAVIRGNLSEVKVLLGAGGATRGVDSTDDASDALTVAVEAARKFGCVAAVTGARDVVTDGTRAGFLDNGHPRLSWVTGTGCMATSLVGCFCGVTPDYYLAALAGILAMGLAGEKSEAVLDGRGTGSFRTGLVDAVSQFLPEDLVRGAKLTETAV